MKLEVITRKPKGPAHPTPLLFVHGAWHGAWCWDEHFLPYFAEHGFTVYALSFRNHGRSRSRGHLRGRRADHYVADVTHFIERLPVPPVLIGHSLGGYVVQKVLETQHVPAAVLMASVPPQGALGITLRIARRLPWGFVQGNLTLRLAPIIASPRLAREALFSPELPAALLNRYFAQLQDESYLAFLDILLLQLPHPQRVPRIPMLVLGGANDVVISPGEVQDTARAYGADMTIFPHIAHDMMLELGWQVAADCILTWLQTVPGLDQHV